jgi:hypothetical protein
MWTDLNAPYDFTPAYIRRAQRDEWEIPPRAFIRIGGWTTFDHRYLPIGGILADITANRGVDIEFGGDVGGDRIFVNGCLTPPLADVPITVEVTDSNGGLRYLYTITDQRGCFDVSRGEDARFLPDKYVVQVFVAAGGEAAETVSDAKLVEVA